MALLHASRMVLTAHQGETVPDPSAYGGSSLLIWADGVATGVISAPAGGQLTVTGKADYCQGPAAAVVSIGRTVVATMAFTSGGWQTTATPAPWPGGRHRVSVAYTNDFKAAGCDRNLRLDKVSVTRTRSATVPVAPARTAVPDTGLAFGLSSPGPQGGVERAAATAQVAGRQLDIVNIYKAWSDRSAFPTDEVSRIAAKGARPEITWEPWNPGLGPHQAGYSLASIAKGAFDAYLTSWAKAAAAYQRPLLLRFGHEMNGSWYPWAPTTTGVKPAEYVAAYRHVHAIFSRAGAHNVSWVWSPNIIQGLPTSLTSLYPGNGFVDVIGVDGYNGGTDVPAMGGWRSPQQVFGSTLAELRRHWPAKPVMINETGSAEHGGSKGGWIGQLFGYLRSTPVSAVVWFDFANPKAADWRVDAPRVTAALRQALTRW